MITFGIETLTIGEIRDISGREIEDLAHSSLLFEPAAIAHFNRKSTHHLRYLLDGIDHSRVA